MTCKSDSDCPQFSKCEKNDTGNNSVCVFGSFLCPLTLNSYFQNNGKKDEYCLYVNTNIWNLDKEHMYESYPKDTKPILKTCPKKEGKSRKMQVSCDTEKCINHEDCLSGKCSKNRCVTIDNFQIYRCTGNQNNVKCGKHYGIDCEKDDECYSGTCYYYSCTNKTKSDIFFELMGNITLIFSIIVFSSTFLFDYFFISDKELKRNRKTSTIIFNSVKLDILFIIFMITMMSFLLYLALTVRIAIFIIVAILFMFMLYYFLYLSVKNGLYRYLYNFITK